jgi:hypothetical protein
MITPPRFPLPLYTPGTPVYVAVRRTLILSGTIMSGEHGPIGTLYWVQGISKDGDRIYGHPTTCSCFNEDRLTNSWHEAVKRAEAMVGPSGG